MPKVISLLLCVNVLLGCSIPIPFFDILGFFGNIFQPVLNALRDALAWFWNEVIMAPFSYLSGQLQSGLKVMVADYGIKLPDLNYFPPIYDLFDLVRNISLGFYALIIVIAGLCYMLESFRLLSEGTAFNILCSSVFTLIIMFLIIPIYQVVAYGFNAIIDKILYTPLQGGRAVVVDPVAFVVDDLTKDAMQPFTWLLVMIVALTALLLIIARFILLLGVIVMSPFLLVLRLIPVTRGIAETLLQALIGLCVAAILSAIVIKVGALFYSYLIVSGAAVEVICAAIILTTLFIPVLVVPQLGSLYGAASVTSAAVTASQQFVMSQMGGVLFGAGAGMLTGALTGTAEAISTRGQVTTGGTLRGTLAHIGRGLVHGVGAGGIHGAMAGMGKGPGGFAAGAGAAIQKVPPSFHGVAIGRARDSIDALMAYYIDQPVTSEPLKSEQEQGTKLRQEILAKPDREVGKLFARKLGLTKIIDTPEEQERFGADMKVRIATLEPHEAYRVMRGLDDFESRPHRERSKLVRIAKSRFKMRPEQVMEIPPPKPPEAKITEGGKAFEQEYG